MNNTFVNSELKVVLVIFAWRKVKNALCGVTERKLHSWREKNKKNEEKTIIFVNNIFLTYILLNKNLLRTILPCAFLIDFSVFEQSYSLVLSKTLFL